MYGGWVRRSSLAQEEPAPPVVVPTPLLWFNAALGTISGTSYTGVTDQGSGAGTFSVAAIATCQFSDLALIPYVSTRILHSAAASTWNFLHNAAGTGSITTRFYVRGSPTSGILLGTHVAGTGIGFSLVASATSKLVARVGNGTTIQDPCTSVGSIVAGWNEAVVTKNGTSFSLSLNGETEVTGSITSPSAGNATNALTMSGTTASAQTLPGYYADVRVWTSVLTADQIALVRAETLAAWGSVPGVRSFVDCEHNLVISAGRAVVLVDQGPLAYVYSPPSTRPLVSTSWRNGKAAMQGGANVGMAHPGFAAGVVPLTSGIYMADVCSWAVATGTTKTLHSGAGNAQHLFSSAGPALANLNGGGAMTISTATQPAEGTACVVECVIAPSAELHIVQDGGADITVTGAMAALAGTNYLGETLLNNDALSQPWTSQYHAAHLLIDHVPTAAGRAEIRAYFQEYYDIEAA